MNQLPWQKIPTPNSEQLELKDGILNLSLYNVTGPYGMSSYVISDSGQDAIDVLVRRHDSLWGKLGIWDEQCQAEYIGQTQVPKRQWSYMLADLDTPYGLIISKSQDQ
jgi:hypothetical protein